MMRLAGSRWNRTDAGLYIPPSAGMGEFSYPTQNDYVDSLSTALASIGPPVRNYLGEKDWGVPILQSVDSMSAIYESVSGVGIGSKTPSEQAHVVADAILGVVQNLYTVTVAVASAIGQAAEVVGALGDVAGSIPLLGAALDVAFGLFSWISGAFEDIRENQACAVQLAYDTWRNKCLRAQHWPVVSEATGSGGSVTAADLFRDNAIAGRGAPMPLSLGSMYIMICAPEAQGYGPSRDEYAKSLASLFENEHWAWPEIDVETKRTMWSLIKGIMSSVRNPGFHDPEPLHGDGGKALFPVLQEIVRRKVVDIWGAEAAQREFEKRAQAMATWLVGYESAWGKCGGEGYTWENYCYPLTRGNSDLAANLVQSVRKWQVVLETDVFPAYQSYLARTRQENPNAKQIVLSEDAARRLLGSSADMGRRLKAIGPARAKAVAFRTSMTTAEKLRQARSALSALTTPQKLLLATAGLGGSYLAYRGIKTGSRLLRARKRRR
jgi:hypothetical protein